MSRLHNLILSARSGGPFGILVLASAAFVPVAVLGTIIHVSGLARPEMPAGDWRYYLGDCLVAAPLVETALMFPVLWLLEKCRVKASFLPLASAVFWAVLHATKYPVQGLMVAWPFWIFSKVIVRWKGVSKNRAYLAAVAIHAIHNLGMFSLQILFWF